MIYWLRWKKVQQKRNFVFVLTEGPITTFKKIRKICVGRAE